jgi:diacylglycerol O-acyltransferase / wax synthase
MPQIDRLSPLDQFMLRVSGTWPQDIGALGIIDGTTLLDAAGRFRIELVRDAIGPRLELVPRFRQVLRVPRRGLGAPFWADARAFDIATHVRELPLEGAADDGALLAAIEQLRREPFDTTRPLWEMWFLTGLPDGRVGWYTRIHHTVADGMAAMLAISALLETDGEPAEGTATRWRPRPAPSESALLADNVRRRAAIVGRTCSVLIHPRRSIRQALAAWPAIRELLAERPATKTSLDRIVGPGRRVVLIRSRLDTFRSIGRAHDATVNDVLLAVTAGGLRTLLLGRGESVAVAMLRIYVPVSLRTRLRGPQEGNRIAQMAVPLELREADPDRRLRRVAAETSARKARLRASLGTLMHGGGIVRRLMLYLVIRQRVNITSASIPGPTRPLAVAGAPILEIFPILPLVANEPLGIGALSYAGAMGIAITADGDAFPDIDDLASAVQAEIAALMATTPAPAGTLVAAPRDRAQAVVG